MFTSLAILKANFVPKMFLSYCVWRSLLLVNFCGVIWVWTLMERSFGGLDLSKLSIL